MQKFIVTGGSPLHGDVRIAGAKNAVLKLMAAAALTDEQVTLTNVPRISDVQIMREAMGDIGFEVACPEPDTLVITAHAADSPFVPLEAAMKMRSSFILLGPMLSRFGRVIISNPGGDRIGRRPVDLHVDAMRSLGAEVEYKNGYYFAKASDGLRGADRLPVRDGDGHRERPPGRRAGARHHRDRERRAGARDGRPGRHAPLHGGADRATPRRIGWRSRGWIAWEAPSIAS